LVLAGPRLVAIMQPAPPKMSVLVNQLWTDMQAAGSLASLLEVLRGYSLDQMPDFAAFVWDGGSLHGLARGRISVVDMATGQTALDGAGALTWHEAPLGTIRGLRVDMGVLEYDALLHLPLVVGAVGASALHLTTDPDQLVRLPDAEHQFPEPVVQQPQPVSEPLQPVSMPETQQMAAAHSEDSQFQRPGAGYADEPQQYGPVGIGVQVNTGEFANVVGGLVVGRAPDAARGPMGSSLMRVPSPGNDISRSHLLIEPAGSSDARVTDLRSTNGTTIQLNGEEPYLLENGESVTVPIGTVLNLGDGVSLRVEQAR
jgi:FHA domain protein